MGHPSHEAFPDKDVGPIVIVPQGLHLHAAKVRWLTERCEQPLTDQICRLGFRQVGQVEWVRKTGSDGEYPMSELSRLVQIFEPPRDALPEG